MDYVNVCDRQNVCRNFSRLIMGTDHLVQANWNQPGQNEMTEQQVFAVLDEAVKLGINFFDTAPIYVGGIENKLGKWLQSRRGDIAQDGFYPNRALNPDRKAYLLSKGGFPFDLYYSKKLEPGSHSQSLKGKLQDQHIWNPNSPASPDGSFPLSNVKPGTYASRLYGEDGQLGNEFPKN
jgi:hypothetical protein